MKIYSLLNQLVAAELFIYKTIDRLTLTLFCLSGCRNCTAVYGWNNKSWGDWTVHRTSVMQMQTGKSISVMLCILCTLVLPALKCTEFRSARIVSKHSQLQDYSTDFYVLCCQWWAMLLSMVVLEKETEFHKFHYRCLPALTFQFSCEVAFWNSGQMTPMGPSN